MADFIQARIDLIHRVEASKPTESEAPTSPSSTTNKDVGEETSTNPKTSGTQGEKAAKRLMRKSSVLRRLGMMAVGMVDFAIKYAYDDRIFKQQLIGNNRGSYKIQQEKQSFNNAVNLGKQMVSTTVTSAVIGGPAGLAIAGIFLAQQGLQESYNIMQYNQAREQFLIQRDVEILTSTHARNRLYLNTYNRRK